MKTTLKAIVVVHAILFSVMPLNAGQEVQLKTYGVGDLSVKVVDYGLADITVKLTDREDADLSVGFTSDPRKADITVTKNGRAGSTIVFKEYGLADLTIKAVDYGLHDLTLAIRSKGKVHLLLYSKDGHLDKKEIIAVIGPLLKRLADKK